MVFRPGPPPAPPLAQPPPAPIAAAASPYVLASGDDLPRLLLLERWAHGFALLNEAGQMVSAEGDPAAIHPVAPALDALASEHAVDTHFTCYGVLNAGGTLEEQIPRLTKGVVPLLPEYGLVRSVDDVVGVAVALDFDLPEHERWSASTIESARSTFAAVGAAYAPLAQPTLWYTTSGGCRFVWLLNEPISIEGQGGLEDILAGLISCAHIAGLPVDLACRDWTRLFRLPRVRRADKQPAEARTQEQSYFRMAWGRVDMDAREVTPPAQVLAYSPRAFMPMSALTQAHFQGSEPARKLYDRWKHLVGKVPSTSLHRQASINLGGVPSDQDIQLTLVGSTGTEGPIVRRVRRLLESKAHPASRTAKPWPSAIESIERLYGNQPLFTDVAQLEGLHEGILRAARDACFTLRDQLGEAGGEVSPQVLFALLIRAARRSNDMRAPEQRRSDGELKTEVWRALSHVYRQFRFQLIARAEERAEESAAAALRAEATRLFADGAERAIKAQMLEWALESVPGEREHQQALLASDPNAVISTPVTEFIERQWRHMLILDAGKHGRSVLNFGRDGQISYGTLAESDGTLYAAIRDSGHALISDLKPPAQPGSEPTLRPVSQLIRDYGTQASLRLSRLVPHSSVHFHTGASGIRVELVARAAGIRQDIRPVYDPLVDQWLRYLGGDWQDKLLDWLAAFPLLERPIAGLYLQGNPDIGKGMLVLGLKNLCESRSAAPWYEVVDQFQESMRNTPLVWADEEAGSASGSPRSTMNMYKKLVTGELQTLSLKSKSPVIVDGYWRVVMTANTDKLLSWDEDVNEADLGALVQRTLHILCDSTKAAEHLRQLGGRAGTEGWPERNIPQHVMWLAQNRKVVPGSRLYVEGERTEFHENLSVNTGGTDLVVRALGAMLREPVKYPMAITVEREQGRVWVNPSGMRNAMLALFQSDASVHIPTMRKVVASITHLSASKRPVARSTGVATKGAVVVRMYELNVTTVLTQLDRMGEQFDIRAGIGEEMWRLRAPPQLQRTIDELSQPRVVASGGVPVADAHVHPLIGGTHVQPEVIVHPAAAAKHRFGGARADAPEGALK